MTTFCAYKLWWFPMAIRSKPFGMTFERTKPSRKRPHGTCPQSSLLPQLTSSQFLSPCPGLHSPLHASSKMVPCFAVPSLQLCPQCLIHLLGAVVPLSLPWSLGGREPPLVGLVVCNLSHPGLCSMSLLISTGRALVMCVVDALVIWHLHNTCSQQMFNISQIMSLFCWESSIGHSDLYKGFRDWPSSSSLHPHFPPLTSCHVLLIASAPASWSRCCSLDPLGGFSV